MLFFAQGRQEKSPRTMIAEDNDWSSSKVPLLSDLCLAHISNNFESEHCYDVCFNNSSNSNNDN